MSGGVVRRCASLNTTIEKMVRNLEALQRERGQTAGYSNGRSRARLLAALDANGCRDDAIAERMPPPAIDGDDRTDDLRDPFFPGEMDQEEPLDDASRRSPSRIIIGGEERSPEIGAYRTLCVRTCDGYFFPMSYAASIRDFERDQKNCESICPGAEMQVFFRDTEPGRGGAAEGEDSGAMVSTVTGRPYSELPTAYLYKDIGTPRPQGCGCNAARNFEVIGGGAMSASPQAEISGSFIAPPVPGAKAEMKPGIDAAPPAANPPAVKVPDDGRKVRVVGPKFLPDPEAAIDLQAPAPKQVR